MDPDENALECRLLPLKDLTDSERREFDIELGNYQAFYDSRAAEEDADVEADDGVIEVI